MHTADRTTCFQAVLINAKGERVDHRGWTTYWRYRRGVLPAIEAVFVGLDNVDVFILSPMAGCTHDRGTSVPRGRTLPRAKMRVRDMTIVHVGGA